MFIRAGGAPNGILNNDDNIQTFNVPIKLTSATGIAGAAAGMVFNAAAGGLVFNGNNNAPATPWTINLNGASNLTFTGSQNITVGSSGPGQIVNTNLGTFSGLVKNGTGTLFLGGTAANTFVGTNFLNQGSILAGKVDALGAGNALVLRGGDLMSGGLNQSLGTLDLQVSSIIDFGSGASAISFANSSAFTWLGSSLVLSNWTSSSDTLRFGIDTTGLSNDELSKISWADLPGATAQIDSGGFVTPVIVPEPSVLALGVVGGSILLRRARRSRKA
jgi:autotransporter-associated beta strand protein